MELILKRNNERALLVEKLVEESTERFFFTARCINVTDARSGFDSIASGYLNCERCHLCDRCSDEAEKAD